MTSRRTNNFPHHPRPRQQRQVSRRPRPPQGGLPTTLTQLRVQLNTDLDAMPVEDASVEWDEDASPYRTVGRIVVAPQLSMGTDLAGAVDQQTFFSPWHGFAARQPLGSVNRARRQAYEMSAEFRATFNGCPMHDSFPAGTGPAENVV